MSVRPVHLGPAKVSIIVLLRIIHICTLAISKAGKPVITMNQDTGAKKNQHSVELMTEMTNYSMDRNISDVLQKLMEKLLREQPADPLNFLIHTVQTDTEIRKLDEQWQSKPMTKDTQ